MALWGVFLAWSAMFFLVRNLELQKDRLLGQSSLTQWALRLPGESFAVQQLQFFDYHWIHWEVGPLYSFVMILWIGIQGVLRTLSEHVRYSLDCNGLYDEQISFEPALRLWCFTLWFTGGDWHERPNYIRRLGRSSISCDYSAHNRTMLGWSLADLEHFEIAPQRSKLRGQELLWHVKYVCH